METTRNKEGNGKDHSVSLWKEEIRFRVKITCAQVVVPKVNVGNFYFETYLMQKPCTHLQETLRIPSGLFR